MLYLCFDEWKLKIASCGHILKDSRTGVERGKLKMKVFKQTPLLRVSEWLRMAAVSTSSLITKVFSPQSEWNDKEEFLDVIYWGRQVPFKGFSFVTSRLRDVRDALM